MNFRNRNNISENDSTEVLSYNIAIQKLFTKKFELSAAQLTPSTTIPLFRNICDFALLIH